MSKRQRLNISIAQVENHLLVNCETCKAVIATIDIRVLPDIKIPEIILASLAVHLHPYD